MKSILKPIVLLAFLTSCNLMPRLYVDYADPKISASTPPADVIRIFFDRKGFIYPDFQFDQQQVRENDCRLELFYANNKNIYEQVCSQYHVQPFPGDMKTIDSRNDPLQAALVNVYTEKINNQVQEKEVVFIIHGFNEQPLLPDDTSSSFAETKATEDEIKDRFRGRDFLFVEIYWDGMSADLGSKILKATNSLAIWNNSQASATYAGLELRRILSKLNTTVIRVVTHSHGAGVITTALFNVIKFKAELYADPDSWLSGIFSKYNDALYNTPSQEYHIGMLAPAIPGKNVFDEYYFRTITGRYVYNVNNNYHFIVGFNKYDPVTRKYYVAATKLGSTTLACKRYELNRTKALFNNNPAIIDAENFSRTSAGKKQCKHSWFAYMKNKPAFIHFLDKVFR